MENTKPVSQSRTSITELMIPSYANFGGKVHGGIVLSLMDKVAFVCASKHSGSYCVTASIDGVDFVQPIEVGNLVTLLASVNHVGRTSMVVGIKVIAENTKENWVKHTNTSYFTMVAVNDNGKPLEVPVLTLETPEDARRFIEAVKRKKLKEKYKSNFDNTISKKLLHNDLQMLQGERCIIGFKRDFS